jgi:glutathione synthase/RimK-type ligase-like ATP-grasp enzyme
MFLYQYKRGSRSALALSRALGIKRIKLEGSKFRPRKSKTILNWGSSSMPDEYLSCRVINHPAHVALAANKLEAFKCMKHVGVSVPEFTTDAEEVALDNYDQKPEKVSWVVREKLSGHSGEGIVLLEGGIEDVPEGKLYVRYIPKKDEYRVHVCGGEVIDLQRKARSKDVPDDEVNWKIRNHSNGFIFARNEGKDVPVCVREESVKAVEALGLDFGAVDVVYNEKQDKAYVLEVNTAPGLEGTTLESYAEALKNYEG